MAGFFSRLKAGLRKTATVLNTPIGELLRGRKLDEDFLEELEEALIRADVGPRTAMEVVEDLRALGRKQAVQSAEETLAHIKAILTHGIPAEEEMQLRKNPDGLTILLMIGVNGTGKTTSTAKLAHYLKTEKNARVVLAAADTFRAAASEQLQIWADRIGVDLVRHKDGADPGAVVYDACDAALARGADYLIVDTAGRIHNKKNLMQQLDKIRRVAEKKVPGAPHETLLVLDAVTGQNALSQAQTFTDGVGVTGLVLTKLDGTAKGGVVIAINRQVRLPIKFIGTGETVEDFAPFNPEAFCDALFEDIRTGEGV